MLPTHGLAGKVVSLVLLLTVLSHSSSMSRPLDPRVRNLPMNNGQHLAHVTFKGKSPGIVVMNGFRSEMTGRKALALQEWCCKRGRAFSRFDYRGHGQSSNRFEDLTLGDWIDDALSIIDSIEGNQVLVGSSMGAWIALHVAMRRSDRIIGIVGIAAAPDFTTDFYNALSTEQMNELHRNGILQVDSQYSDKPYTFSRNLLEESRQWDVLNKGKSSIPILCPVRLLHGQRDEDIPWQKSIELAEALETNNVHVTLIKDGNHRLSRAEDLAQVSALVQDLIQDVDNSNSIQQAT